MSCLQYIFISLVVILVCDISCDTIDDDVTTIQSIFSKAVAELIKLENDFKRDREQLEIDQKKLADAKKLPNSIENTDIIQLNVGGEIMMTTRETLTRVPKSTLSIMFNGRWEHKLQIDKIGNIFLDFNPILFRHLLDQLQILEINKFVPPSESSLVEPFKKMLQKLGLNQLLSSEKHIVSFNVGGQIITNRQTIFTQISNSTLDQIVSSPNTTKFDSINSDVFLDYDPKLFRHLISQLREDSSKEVCYLKLPGSIKEIFYKKMLVDFDICENRSSNPTTLLLSDTNTAIVKTLVNNLQAAGLSVNYISGGITTYTGSPNASAYGSVILITGNEETTDMPLSGQQSILNAQQNNGTGVVMTEWAAYHVLNGRWSTLSSLLLATRIVGATATMSYTLVNSGHPIWNSLATSFSTSVKFGYSQLNTPKNGSIIIANCTTCGGPAVIVRPGLGRAGRIVQIAHSDHGDTTQFNWGNDANVQTMMINAVKWAAQLI